MRYWTAVSIFIVLLALLTIPAFADPVCKSDEQTTDYLFSAWGETIYATGITETGEIMKYYRNEKTKTWTIIIYENDGHCFLYDGDHATFPTPGRPL